MLKRVVFILLAIGTTIVLAACGEESSQSANADTTSSTRLDVAASVSPDGLAVTCDVDDSHLQVNCAASGFVEGATLYWWTTTGVAEGEGASFLFTLAANRPDTTVMFEQCVQGNCRTISTLVKSSQLSSRQNGPNAAPGNKAARIAPPTQRPRISTTPIASMTPKAVDSGDDMKSIACSLNENSLQLSCYGSAFPLGTEMLWQTNVSGTSGAADFETVIEQDRLEATILISLEACKDDTCEYFETIIDTSRLVTKDVAPTATPLSEELEQDGIAEKLSISCSLSGIEKKLRCEAQGIVSGMVLEWSSNVSGTIGGKNFSVIIDDNQLRPNIDVYLKACSGSTCKTVDTTVDASHLLGAPPAEPIMILPFDVDHEPGGIMAMGETIIHKREAPWGHPGIDFQFDHQAPLIAVADGTVIRIYEFEHPDMGQLFEVSIVFGPYISNYTKLGKVAESLQVDDRVTAGQVVGYPADIGAGDGWHVTHWEFGTYKMFPEPKINPEGKIITFNTERICPVPYFTESEQVRLSAIWDTANSPIPKDQFPDICNGPYKNY